MFTEANDDGAGNDNWSYKMCKAPVKSLPLTNQHPFFYRPDALPVANQQCQSTEGIAANVPVGDLFDFLHVKILSSVYEETRNEWVCLCRS